MGIARALLVFVGLSVASSGFASSFSYTFLGGALGKLTLDDELVFAGEVYKEFGVTEFFGSYQFHDSLAIGLFVGGFGNDGPNTEISGSDTILHFSFPVPVSNTVDLVPQLGFIRSDIEVCLNNLCAKDDESGLVYGLGVRAWAAPDQLELNAGIADSTIEGSDPLFSLGGALWFANHHSLLLDYGNSKDFSIFTLGYRYSWR